MGLGNLSPGPAPHTRSLGFFLGPSLSLRAQERRVHLTWEIPRLRVAAPRPSTRDGAEPGAASRGPDTRGSRTETPPQGGPDTQVSRTGTPYKGVQAQTPEAGNRQQAAVGGADHSWQPRPTGVLSVPEKWMELFRGHSGGRHSRFLDVSGHLGRPCVPPQGPPQCRDLRSKGAPAPWSPAGHWRDAKPSESWKATVSTQQPGCPEPQGWAGLRAPLLGSFHSLLTPESLLVPSPGAPRHPAPSL